MEKKVQGLNLKALKGALTSAATNAAQLVGQQLKAGVESVGALKATRDYELGPQVASGGPGRLWSIYRATAKRPSTGVPANVCVWVLDKKALVMKEETSTRKSRADVETLLESFRRDGARLLRLRHPGIIRVLEPLEENRTQMMLVTEAVSASVYDVLHQDEANAPPELRQLQLSPVEIKHGLMQLAQTVSFLGLEAGIVHCAISPETVFVAGGAWKLAGFGFSLSTAQQAQSVDASKPYLDYPSEDARADDLPLLPPLGYVAPELVTGGGRVTAAADVFSLAALAQELLTHRQLLPTANNLLRYHNLLDQLPAVPLEANLQGELRAMLAVGADSRPLAADFAAAPWFSSDPQLRTLASLEKLPMADTLSKAAFLRELARTWQQFDLRVLLHKVLPPLLTELRTPAVHALALPLVLSIAAKQAPDQFLTVTLPELQPLLSTVDGDALVMLLGHLPTMAALMPPASADSVVLPLLTRACDSSDRKIQECAVQTLHKVAAHVGGQGLQEQLLPRVHRLVMSTHTAAVRVHGMTCYGHILPRLDADNVAKVLETIARVVQIDNSAPTVMCALAVADAVSKHGGAHVTATRLLPMLTPLLMAKSLNATQLASFLSTVRDMLSRVEAKQLPTLRERDQLQKLSTSDDVAAEYAAREQLPPARPPAPPPMRTANANPIASVAPASSIAPAASAMLSPHMTVADPIGSMPPLGSSTSTQAAVAGAAWADQQHLGSSTTPLRKHVHATQPGHLLDL